MVIPVFSPFVKNLGIANKVTTQKMGSLLFAKSVTDNENFINIYLTHVNFTNKYIIIIIVSQVKFNNSRKSIKTIKIIFSRRFDPSLGHHKA